MAFAQVLLASAFALVTDAHGVRVQMRSEGSVIELIADGSFAAPPERVLAVMIDYDHARDWQKQLAESRVLNRDAHSLDVYQRLELPIVSDRDYTLHVTWGNDDRGVWMRFALANDRGPAPSKGLVRIPVHEGSWRLDRASGGQATTAHYEVRMDLGGSLPPSLTRKRVAKNIPDLFEGLRKRLAP